MSPNHPISRGPPSPRSPDRRRIQRPPSAARPAAGGQCVGGGGEVRVWGGGERTDQQNARPSPWPRRRPPPPSHSEAAAALEPAGRRAGNPLSNRAGLGIAPMTAALSRQSPGRPAAHPAAAGWDEELQDPGRRPTSAAAGALRVRIRVRQHPSQGGSRSCSATGTDSGRIDWRTCIGAAWVGGRKD